MSPCAKGSPSGRIVAGLLVLCALLAGGAGRAHDVTPATVYLFSENGTGVITVADAGTCNASVFAVPVDPSLISVTPTSAFGVTVSFTVQALPGSLSSGPTSTRVDISWIGEDYPNPPCNENNTSFPVSVPVDLSLGPSSATMGVFCAGNQVLASDTASVVLISNPSANCPSPVDLSFTGSMSATPSPSSSTFPVLTTTAGLVSDTASVLQANKFYFSQNRVGVRQLFEVSGSGGIASGEIRVNLDGALEVDLPFSSGGRGDARMGFDLNVPEAFAGGVGSAELTIDSDGGISALGDVRGVNPLHSGTFHSIQSDTTFVGIPFSVSAPFSAPNTTISVDLGLTSATGIDTFGLSDTTGVSNGFASVFGPQTLRYTIVPDPGSSFTPIPAPEPSAGLIVALVTVGVMAAFRGRSRAARGDVRIGASDRDA